MVGEKVILARMQEGQKHIVLYRINWFKLENGNDKDALKCYLRDKIFVLKDIDESKGIGGLTWDFSVHGTGYASLTGNDVIIELLQKYETIEI